jgi:hypothetical protein
LIIENLALRQQVMALKRDKTRPLLYDTDRAFWVALRGAWRGWADRLVIVKPETVVKWHRERFRRYWRNISQRHRGQGRSPIDLEIRKLIRKMAMDNCWRAPRIHSELQKLGFVVSERTVSRYIPRKPKDPDAIQRWVVFLRNHLDVTAAMDFFTVPTVRRRVLYCWFVIHHGRRKILHFNTTYHPTAEWVMQQLREAFPFETAPRYLVFDRDSIFNRAVKEFLRSMGTMPIQTSYRSPWQNPYGERWIGTCRRELLDHVIALGQRHVVQLVRSYLRYYHEDRCHLSLEKDTPDGRPITPRPSPTAKVVSLPRVGGIHHYYEWREAA